MWIYTMYAGMSTGKICWDQSETNLLVCVCWSNCFNQNLRNYTEDYGLAVEQLLGQSPKIGIYAKFKTGHWVK